MPDTISPTTRAAVEEAARLICCGDTCIGEQDGNPCAAMAHYGREVAATIAAYLRAQGRDIEARQVEACGDE